MNTCVREGCEGVISACRIQSSDYCCEVCAVLARKMRKELSLLRRAETAGKDVRARRAGWLALVQVADAVSHWRAALGSAEQD